MLFRLYNNNLSKILNSNINNILVPELFFDSGYITSSSQAYDCNWSDYKLLLIQVGNYGNIFYSYYITPDWFKDTSSGGRLISQMMENTTIWNVEIYQNGSNSIMIKSTHTNKYIRVRMWGVV